MEKRKARVLQKLGKRLFKGEEKAIATGVRVEADDIVIVLMPTGKFV